MSDAGPAVALILAEALAALQKWRPIIKAAGIKADIREQTISMR